MACSLDILSFATAIRCQCFLVGTEREKEIELERCWGRISRFFSRVRLWESSSPFHPMLLEDVPPAARTVCRTKNEGEGEEKEEEGRKEGKKRKETAKTMNCVLFEKHYVCKVSSN